MKYIIPGNPLFSVRPRTTSKAIYETYQHKRLCMEINLSNQHNDEPLFSGILHAEIVFYFSNKTRSKKHNPNSLYYAGHPELFELVSWLKRVGKDIIFSPASTFCSLVVSKKYSEEPRTEFEIRAL